MKKQVIVTLIALSAMVAIAGSAFAWEGCGGKGKRMGAAIFGNGCGQYQEWAKLTDDQKTKLKALHQKFIDETASQRASIISKHQEMRILMETSSPDRAKLHTLSSEISDLKKQVMDRKIDLALDAKAIAPDLNISIGFHKFGKHGFGERGMMCGGMMSKGMGNKHGCPQMNMQPDDANAPEDN